MLLRFPADCTVSDAGQENRARPWKERAFYVGSKYARGDALPNERKFHPALSRFGIIFGLDWESISLASYPAASAEPRARRPWQGRPGPGLTPGSPVGQGFPETFGGASAVRGFEGTARNSGACSFTPYNTGRAVIPSPAPRKLKSLTAKFLGPSICHSFSLQICRPWTSGTLQVCRPWTSGTQGGIAPRHPSASRLHSRSLARFRGIWPGNIAVRSCGIFSHVWDRRFRNGSRNPLS